MIPVEELRHLRHGAEGEALPGDTETLDVECPNGAAEALARVRQVLEPVFEQSNETAEWPGIDEWKRLLPSWFLAACVNDAEVRDCVIDRWSLRAWIYWFQPGLRKWQWWDGDAAGDRLRVTLVVLQRPYLRGALDWLLKVAAA